MPGPPALEGVTGRHQRAPAGIDIERGWVQRAKPTFTSSGRCEKTAGLALLTPSSRDSSGLLCAGHRRETAKQRTLAKENDPGRGASRKRPKPRDAAPHHANGLESRGVGEGHESSPLRERRGESALTLAKGQAVIVRAAGRLPSAMPERLVSAAPFCMAIAERSEWREGPSWSERGAPPRRGPKAS